MKPPPRDPADDHALPAVQARRVWLGADIPLLAGEPVPLAEARGNIEGLVGYAQVPVGVAGPLVLRNELSGSFRVPFATTEGTMVASYQRGMKVCAEAGGIGVQVLHDGLAVWPTLAYASAEDAARGAAWVQAHRAELIAAAEATTRHGKVQRLEISLLGRRLVLELEMHTGDAMGINLVTRAAEALVARIPGGGQRLLHGFDVEKRASTWRPRGKHVVAEVRVPQALVEAHWRTTAASIEEAWTTYQLGFARMGTPTHAIQVMNGLAGIYIATGQDAAYVAESSIATLSLEDHAGDLYASLDLPNLHAATVGGGTRKGTAAECQTLIGVTGARQLACVIAGALLAGDVNLAASFCAGDFVGAHERLGRNRP